MSATAVASGLPVTATVTLTAAAPTDGAVVTLTSSSDTATVPASVTVPAGSTTQTFEVQTVVASAATTVTITATYNNVARTTTLSIGKLALQSLTLSASSVVAGSPVAGTVTLTAPAPAGGVQVLVAADSAAARVPASVTIASGDTAQTFEIGTAAAAAAPVVVTITATVAYSGSTRSATLTVGGVSLQSLSLGIDALPGGLPVSGTVTLTVATPIDVVVALSSSSDAARVPPSVTIPAGATSQTFDIATVNRPPTTAVTIAATYGGATRSAVLTVISYPVMSGLTCTSTMPKGGTSVACTGTLTSPAPPGGWQLAVDSSDTSLAGAVPSSLTVPASSLTFQFEVVTAPVASNATAVIRVTDIPSGLLIYSQALTVLP